MVNRLSIASGNPDVSRLGGYVLKMNDLDKTILVNLARKMAACSLSSRLT
jgi:hypothetical protein